MWQEAWDQEAEALVGTIPPLPTGKPGALCSFRTWPPRRKPRNPQVVGFTPLTPTPGTVTEVQEGPVARALEQGRGSLLLRWRTIAPQAMS